MRTELKKRSANGYAATGLACTYNDVVTGKTLNSFNVETIDFADPNSMGKTHIYGSVLLLQDIRQGS
jgi:hypothetical protein